MKIVATCTQCQAQFKVDETHAGKKLKCSKCGGPVVVPGVNVPTPPAAPTSAPKAAPTSRAPTSAKPAAPSVASAYTPPPVPADWPADEFSAEPESQPVTQPAAPTARDEGDEWSFLSSPAAPPAAGSTPTSAPRADRPVYAAKKSSQNSPALWIILGVCAVLLVGGGIAYFALKGSGDKQPVAKKNEPAAPTSTADAKLVVPLPDGTTERGNIMIIFDGRPATVPLQGDYVVTVRPGNHEILLQRRGYQSVNERFPLTGGEERKYEPKWQALEAAATPPPATIVGSSDDNPTGFEGWYQSPDEALQKAAAEKKDVIIALMGTDWSDDCKEMQEEVFSQEEFKRRLGKQYIFCLLDFPKRQNRNKVKDRTRNDMWREKLNVDVEDVPVIVMLDSQGQMFGITKFVSHRFAAMFMDDDDRKITTEDLVKRIVDFQDNRKDMRKHVEAIAAASGSEKMRVLRAALDWVVEKRLQLAYELILKGWYADCQKLDPKNEQGHLEVFFEHSWLNRLSKPSDSNQAKLTAVLKELDDFRTAAAFKDQDRGAKLHLIAAYAYEHLKRGDDATRHLTAAKKFNPTNARLAMILKRINPGDIGVIGSGSGYVVAPGYVMTNHHVVEHGKRIFIRVPGLEDPVAATIVATDKKVDMALLRTDDPGAMQLKPLPVVADPVRLGMPVAAVGFPLGSAIGTGVSFTRGGVSKVPEEANQGMILIDALVNPGNSGGALCDNRGAVIGMITAKTRNLEGRDRESYGMAIPGDTLVKFLTQHIPNFSPVSAPKQPLTKDSQDWSEVAASVSPSVLMILAKE